jgi:DNA-binding HxlR family transcriptional regulator
MKNISKQQAHKIQADGASYEEFRTALKIVGDKWSALILLGLLQNPQRFTEIELNCPGLSPRTLTQRLRMLEKAGLITRKTYKEFPPRTEYAATKKAHELKAALMELKKWAKKYCKSS